MSPASRLGWALCGLALSCFSQTLQISGPSTGLVFDAPTGSLRRILGNPGAARLSTPLLSGLDWASVAPDGVSAVISLQGETRLVTAADLDGSPIDAVLPEPRFSAWAPDSSSVALYSPAAAAIQWLRRDGSLSTAEPSIPLTGAEGSAVAFAADAASRQAFIAIDGAGLFRVSAADGTSLLLPAPHVSALAVEPGGAALWAADRDAAAVIQILQPGSSEPAVSPLLTDSEKLTDISALGLGAGGRHLYIADRAAKLLFSFDRDAAALSEGIALDTPAAALLPLGRPSLLFLGARQGDRDALYLLDERTTPTLFFVPVPPAEGATAQ